MREKKKEREELKASCPKILLMGKRTFYNACVGLLYCPRQAKLQKEPKSKAITRDKMGRKPKRETKVKKSNEQQEGTVNRVNSGVR